MSYVEILFKEGEPRGPVIAEAIRGLERRIPGFEDWKNRMVAEELEMHSNRLAGPDSPILQATIEAGAKVHAAELRLQAAREALKELKTKLADTQAAEAQEKDPRA